MKEERYVIADTVDRNLITYCTYDGMTEDIMAATLYDDSESAIIALYRLKKTKTGPYRLFKVSLQINEVQITLNEIPDGPIPRTCEVDPPREPFGPKSRSLTPN